MFFGVNASVPKHVSEQQKLETVGFVNTAGVMLDGIDNQLEYKEPFSFNNLPEPFNKPDLVVFHEVYQRKLLPVFNLTIKKKIPYVIIPHGCLTVQSQNKKKLKKLAGNFAVYNRIIKNAAAIQCLSEQEMNESHFGRYKFIGSNGADMGKAEKTFGGYGMIFIYIGRLDVEIKGLDILINAVGRCRKLLIENGCHVDIYGPNEEDSFEKLRKLVLQTGTDKIIRINGPVIGEKKQEKLMKADCFIQCSRTEGMSMGILEALASGLPCILTRGTGISEAVYDCGAGWKCENDILSVAAAIEDAVKNKDKLPEYSLKAAEFAKENYSWSKVAADAVNEYKKLLK